jgi:hypothetical protein
MGQHRGNSQLIGSNQPRRFPLFSHRDMEENVMFKISMIAVVVLALSASAAAAQSNSVSKDYAGPQQASAPWKADKAPVSFIYDEFGNVYDGRGDIITPKAVKRFR